MCANLVRLSDFFRIGWNLPKQTSEKLMHLRCYYLCVGGSLVSQKMLVCSRIRWSLVVGGGTRLHSKARLTCTWARLEVLTCRKPGVGGRACLELAGISWSWMRGSPELDAGLACSWRRGSCAVWHGAHLHLEAGLACSWRQGSPGVGDGDRLDSADPRLYMHEQACLKIEKVYFRGFETRKFGADLIRINVTGISFLLRHGV